MQYGEHRNKKQAHQAKYTNDHPNFTVLFVHEIVRVLIKFGIETFF